ncbi:hypothetical protein [Adhaeribacter arboris]|uniref:hypothetical protein n=1 Tax=Adhaeribacter arboris TaxID=2072846 RepID=UPI0011B241F3|nr:hypothetical protein [Adhaeribacter arboris]
MEDLSAFRCCGAAWRNGVSQGSLNRPEEPIEARRPGGKQATTQSASALSPEDGNRLHGSN